MVETLKRGWAGVGAQSACRLAACEARGLTSSVGASQVQVIATSRLAQLLLGAKEGHVARAARIV
eukprot:7195941-Prymnesium_polylepis.1